jgi:hypothetical protein
MPGLRDSSKRDSSAAQKKRRAASVGMTGLGGLFEMFAKIN